MWWIIAILAWLSVGAASCTVVMYPSWKFGEDITVSDMMYASLFTAGGFITAIALAQDYTHRKEIMEYVVIKGKGHAPDKQK